MGEYFAYDYTGAPFEQLGAAHLGALLVTFLLIVAGWRGRFSVGQRRRLRVGLAMVILVNEIFWHAWHAAYGLWSVRTLLPLNLCNLMVLCSVYTLLSKKQLAYEFTYLLGIPAAVQVLITPALGQYGFPHILFFQIFISHGGIIVAALYLTLGESMRPRSWGAVGRVAGLSILYALFIFGLNQVLGSNYLFLAYKPPAATLLDYLGPWPWYFLSMVAIGLALASLLYLPFWIKDRARLKEETVELNELKGTSDE
ncbi:MAG TPA: TIGR02206 family membrane protein [Anaerolineales bacterium]|nr:TIGR02206 family membrane protein [Anaerolineales bacterium]